MGVQSDKILVVDDNPDIRIIMQHRLIKAGYEVATLDDPTLAERVIAEDKTDLVLLDIMMPVLDGFEVLARVRSKHSFEELPVIMLTASSTSQDVVKALALGANDFATKGEQWDVLLRRLRVHLDLKKSTGRYIGPYVVDKKIGAGSMGVVFAAHHPGTGQRVAVKVLPRSAAINDLYVKRFLREAELASRVDHPNIVRILGAGRLEETYYLAMELIAGDNLLTRFGGLPVEPQLSLAIVRDVARALQALHQAGVTHRDVKPDNIVLSDQGRVVLTDFGVAADLGETDGRLTALGTTVGSPSYCGPEQLEGRAEPRSDVYALGATLYWMLTGVVPFCYQDLREIYRAKKQGPLDPRAVNARVPAALARVVMTMLLPDVASRYPDCDALIAALDTAEGSVRR